MKHALTPLLLLTAVAFAFTTGARAEDNSAITTNLKQIENDWAKSPMDKDHGAAFVSKTLADDYAGVSSRAKHQSKADYVDETKSATDTVSSGTNSHMKVHVYSPTVATVTGDYTEKGKDKSGQSYSRTFVWVDTFMERNGKWECIAEGSTLKPDKK